MKKPSAFGRNLKIEKNRKTSWSVEITVSMSLSPRGCLYTTLPVNAKLSDHFINIYFSQNQKTPTESYELPQNQVVVYTTKLLLKV
uniref:Uncharacterized protein n=1 Tax=Heterorhabditis bacteriophora TaxID=37862 RepID=A0A1I7WJV8_HETBA